MVLRLGIIGISEGNGHPYSWSAICNGYDGPEMAKCGFPAIPTYLSAQEWPTARMTDVEVTHVWTQDVALSEHIAAAALIKTVVRSPEEMIGQVDGILLARDDAENHFRFASPFLAQGIPIYIDKPIALTRADLLKLYGAQKYPGQIFTCSALRYATELRLDEATASTLGRLRVVHAVTPKDWNRYAIHAIEPVLNLVGTSAAPEYRGSGDLNSGGRWLLADLGGDLSIMISALGEHVVSPINIRLYGENGWCDLLFSDSFSAFKAALSDFVAGVRTKSIRSPRDFNFRAVQVLEMGRS